LDTEIRFTVVSHNQEWLMKSLTLIFIHNLISSILIFLKLEEVISWSWWVVTAPIWGVSCLLVGVFAIFGIWGLI